MQLGGPAASSGPRPLRFITKGYLRSHARLRSRPIDGTIVPTFRAPDHDADSRNPSPQNCPERVMSLDPRNGHDKTWPRRDRAKLARARPGVQIATAVVRGAGRNRPKGARASRLRAFKQESAPRQGTSVEYRSVILRRGKTGHASLIVLLKHETKRDWNIALRSGECFNPDEKHNRLQARGGRGVRYAQGCWWCFGAPPERATRRSKTKCKDARGETRSGMPCEVQRKNIVLATSAHFRRPHKAARTSVTSKRGQRVYVRADYRCLAHLHDERAPKQLRLRFWCTHVTGALIHHCSVFPRAPRGYTFRGNTRNGGTRCEH